MSRRIRKKSQEKKGSFKNRGEGASGNVIDLNSFRKKNMASISSAREIFSEMDNPNNILAVGFYVTGGEDSPKFMATSKINPLEAAGLLLNFASICSQKGFFEDIERPPLVSEKDKPPTKH